MRAPTELASAGEGLSVRGKVSARPARTLTLRGRISIPLRTWSAPKTATGSTAAPVSSARRPKPRLGRPSEPVLIRVPSGKMQIAPPRSSTLRDVIRVSSSDWPRRTGYAPSRFSSQPCQRGWNSSTLAT